MKLTQNQLRRVIREFLEEDFPSDVEAVEDAWAGGDDLVLPIDHSKAVKSDPVTDTPEMLPSAEPILSKEGKIRAKQRYLRNLARRTNILRK
jgi:hypothetical protein